MSTSYEADFYSWALEQADAVRRRSSNEIDWDRLAEEIAGLARAEEWELYKCYQTLLTHLLLWIYLPQRRSRTWENNIATLRMDIHDLIDRSPGLKSVDAKEFSEAYQIALLNISTETDKDVEAFPETPPFTLEQAKDQAWLPD